MQQSRRAGRLLPGITGHAGAEQRVPDGDENEMLMKPTVHPAVWHHIVTVADGTTCRQTQEC